MKYYKILFFAIIFTNQWLIGQNFKELQKLQSEYKKALERQALQKPADISEAEKTAKSTALPDKLIYSRKDIESLLVNTENLLKELRFIEDSSKKMPYIGYEFFTKRDSIPFWQNLPISQNYLLGPGDEVIISLWGESNSYSVETINRDGQIFIEKIGVLNLGGKSVDEAKKLILSKYSKVYSTLIGQSPKSFIDLTLGELKSINVHFVGFVNIPGIHIVHPFSNVIAGLIQAGGVDINGSLRDVTIIRNNQNIASLDIYDYLIKGKSFNDMRLMDQDIVYISPRKSTIPITGRVKRPGYYEILNNESLADLINYSGDVDRWATKSIFLHKNGASDKSGYLVGLDKASKFLISQGDSVHIPQEQNFQNFVVVHGQIKNPGKYPYNENMRLNDLINASMSLNDDFIETMDLSSINIFRRNPSGVEPLSIISTYDENILLKNGDHITIGRNKFYKSIESIIITGEISKPGTYPVNNLTNLSNILDIAGGYTELALFEGIEIFRDSLKIAWENDEFILKNGDSLNVVKKTGLILVDGEVNVPGYISFKKGDSVKKYIKRAGGFTSFAQRDNIYVVYPNGTSVPISSWSSPEVKDGSTIVVNPRTISGNNRISGWQAFSMISSQAGNIATTLLSLSIIMSQNNSGN
tara:strand:- start:14106 stop:16031 length:1926 start_codon:yes stop_codon:yes gene_type:complete